MKKNFLFVVAATICFFVVGVVQAAINEPEAVPGEYVIQFEEGMTPQSFQTLGYDLRKNNISPIAVVKVPLVMTSAFVIQELKAQKGIKYIEPNYIYRPNRLPDDPEFHQLWGLKNDGGSDSALEIDIDAEEAWDIQTGNPELVMAVIDTGVDHSFEDLKDNMWVNPNEIPGNGIDDDENGFIDDVHGYDFDGEKGDPMDIQGHGTHCAGVIGGKGNNGIGISGVAWDIKIMAIKFLGFGGGTLENAVKSVDYARQMGADIMSNSWGGGGASDVLREAIERAHAEGILFVAAAGNNRSSNDNVPAYPANYETANVLSVAAIGRRGGLASFSNYGVETVDVAAPGVNIVSSTPRGYRSMSGTSMAAPYVSGIAALLLSQEPELTPEEMITRLKKTSKGIAGLRSRVASGGIVSAYYALLDEVAPVDENDPFYWETVSVSFESEHPYKDEFRESFEVTAPEGATHMSLYFDRFETEERFDKLIISDADGNEIATLSGSLDGSFSPVIPGNKAMLRFVSDRSTNFYGYSLTKVAYRVPGSEEDPEE